MRIATVAVLVLVQFTILPFIHMMDTNKPAHFIVKNTIIYKSS